MNLFLDIETIGTTDQSVIDEIASGITHPGNISKPETIAAWEAEKKPALVDDAVRKTSFDGGLGRVICVGMAIDDKLPQTFTGDEVELLRWVWTASNANLLHSPNVVGHNVTWDVRFLWQRFVVNRVDIPAWLRSAVKAKPWDISDTMTMWNPDRDRRVSLDKLCRILGVPSSKGDMDGSKVWDAYRDGRITEIADYCARDVIATRECYRRMVG